MSCRFPLKSIIIEQLTAVLVCFQLGTRLFSDYSTILLLAHGFICWQFNDQSANNFSQRNYTYPKIYPSEILDDDTIPKNQIFAIHLVR